MTDEDKVAGSPLTFGKMPTHDATFEDYGLYCLAFALMRGFHGSQNWGDPINFMFHGLDDSAATHTYKLPEQWRQWGTIP